MDAFSASYGGHSESDGFNALIMGADLDWRDVSVLRSIGRYLRQVGFTYSQSYFAQALSRMSTLPDNSSNCSGPVSIPGLISTSRPGQPRPVSCRQDQEGAQRRGQS